MLEMQRGSENGYVEADPSGRYGRFKDILGKGAMKTVYRAFDELLGIEVAWNQAKICDVLRSPEALEHLYSEVNLLSTLHHDSIMKFHTSWVDSRNRTFNFITELFTSGTLREYRHKYRHVDVRAVKNWARQILHGLVYLHGRKPPVIHRDLKCDNIFVNGSTGQVKIGDLGLAAVLSDAQPAHSIIGTPEFMAPELYDEEYNELIDVYSFGMCVLEMLTAEYPYSECSNPAQIYKKVTSGKLPSSLNRIQDPKAQKFISKCLVSASKRPSAKELLSDPFLKLDSVDPPQSTRGGCMGTPDISSRSRVVDPQNTVQDTDMKITGKMNPDDDTIFLRVHFADKNGQSRNIYFPFDIIGDTPTDVANEMVKELDITERDPSVIAEMIDREISSLVPDWKDGRSEDGNRHVLSYSDEDDGSHPPLSYLSSSASSSGSIFGYGDMHGARGSYQNNGHLTHQWLQDRIMFPDDDDDDDDNTSSHSSFHPDRYSYVNMNSIGKQESEPSPERHDHRSTSQNQKASRFCPEENSRAPSKHRIPNTPKQCEASVEASKQSSSCGTKKRWDDKRLVRNRSLVDSRSQLLHKTLVEEVNKRASKTVGALEDIGYQHPYESSGMWKKSSRGFAKNLGLTWSKS